MRDQKRFAETASAYDLPEPSFDADLALVGRGTKMGELLRRYWHPVYVSSKLTDLPVQVQALGEDVVLFRKPTGEVGAVYPRCVHRGTSLLWGQVTEKGIRCCYHGWTFETDGRCVSQPCEPNDGGNGKKVVRQPWYPAQERYGLIFVYLGPLDKKPPLPRYDVLETIPEGWELVVDDLTIPAAGAEAMPCNWLQHHENGMDPHHLPILHAHQFPPIVAQAKSTYTFFKDEHRIRGNGVSTFGETIMDFKAEMIIPTVRLIPTPTLNVLRPDGKADSVSWTLPIHDTDTMVFTVQTAPIGAGPPPVDLYNGKTWKELTPEEHQRFPGDFEAQTGQGLITYHSEEHLVSSDKGVVLFRRLLQAGIKDMEAGRQPPLTSGSEDPLIETWSGVQFLPNPDHEPAETAEPAPIVSDAPGEAAASGRWALTLHTPMGVQELILELVEQDGRLSGKLFNGDDSVPITDASKTGNAVAFKAKVDKPMPMTLSFDLAIAGDAMSGTFKPGMFPKGDASAKRLA